MSDRGRPFTFSLRAVIATLIVFAVAIACVRLGFWQLDRLQQRRQRNADVRARLATAAAELAAVPQDSTGWLYRRVIVRGKFDDARSIILPGRAFQGAPGAHVVTPVLVANGQAVLVDRGWVPAADGATVDLAALPPVGEVADTALVLPFPGEERRLGRVNTTTRDSSTAFRGVWFALDEAALRRQFSYVLDAIHVRLLPAQNAPAMPVREELPALNEGPHLGYAIQWFSFAIIVIVGWLAMVRKSRSVPRRPTIHR